MDTQNNLIIIYSSKDEDASLKTSWVNNFHRFLELLLGRLLRDQVKINLTEIQELDLDKIYSTSTILIPIATEHLLLNSIFKEEIKKFHEKGINKGQNSISWSSRIFKVFREPTKGHFLLDFLSNSLGYNFYHRDPLTNEVVQYNDFTSPESQKTFWMRLYDLAYDISKIQQDINSGERELQTITQQINKESIYLSAVGSDLENDRSIIKRELQRSGFQVLPDNNIPDDLDAALRMIRNDIARCKMAIHLVGADPGKIKGTNSSLIELQLRIASELLKDDEKMGSDKGPLPLGRIIWITPHLDKVSVKQKIFIENLKKDSDAIKKADVLESNVEELKGFISNKISQYRSTATEKIQKKKDAKVIYLICNNTEAEKCKPIKDYLNSFGYQVITSTFEGSPNEVRTEHFNNLKKCDATLVYYGGSNDNWMKTKLQDLSKSLGFEREKPLGLQAVIIDSEEKFDDLFKARKNTMVLYSKGSSTEKSLEPFLAQLQS